MDAIDFFSRFEPMLNYALHVRDTDAGRRILWEEVSSRLTVLVEQERMEPVDTRLAGCLDDCRLVVYALIDEWLMDSPRMGEPTAAEWYRHRLQTHYAYTDRAGELVFTRLDAMLERMLVDPTKGYVASKAFSPLDLPEKLEKSVTRCLNEQHTTLCAASSYKLTVHDNQEAVPTEADALALSVYTLCLLYGFKGLYYAPDKAAALTSMRHSAATLWQPLATPAASTTAVTPTPHQKPLVPALLDGWAWLHIGIPLVLTGVWYIVCADITTRIVF